MKKYCFGVDIGGTTVKIGLFTISGGLIEKWEIATRKEEDSKYVLSDIVSSIEAKLKERKIAKKDVEGIGYGVPAPVSQDGVVSFAANLGWKNKAVTQELMERTGLFVKGGNDVNTAALGEIWRGAAKEYKNVVMITLGTGVGGAIIVNGKAVPGATGGGGEVGHIHVEDECKIPCGCGSYGCMEQYGSASGVVRMARELLEKYDTSSILRNREITAKTVFDAVKMGDSIAIEVAEKFGKYVGMAMAAVSATIEPEIFLVGGGVSKAGPIILKYIQKYYEVYAWQGIANKKFVLAKLGNDAGIYGAASYISLRRDKD
ncbi:MAG: ROK family glucokinase [Tyzzerella sp.]|nr:ROK family glucokinase [Tyzzerella sp.]